MKPSFEYCHELIVYRDMAFAGDGSGRFVDTGISGCECKAYQQGRKCKRRGRCIIARESDTWLQVNSKTFVREEWQDG
jgi:hypothetical protein